MAIPATHNSSQWSIDASFIDAPDDVQTAFHAVIDGLNGSDWQPRLVDVSADVKGRSQPQFFAVLTRQFPLQNLAQVSETWAEKSPENCSISAGQGDFEQSGQNPLWERDNGRTEREAIIPPAEAPSEASLSDAVDSPPAFGDLPTVRAMGTGQRAVVIGFDTEFTETVNSLGRKSRVVNSYQFAVTPADGVRTEVVILPLVDGDRIFLEDGLYIVALAAGLHRYSKAGEIDPRGVPYSSIERFNSETRALDYKKTLDAAFKSAIPIVLACHFAPADLTAFKRPPAQRRGGEKYSDVLRHVTSASGGWVTLLPFRVVRKSGLGSNSLRWLPFSLTLRDTMGQVSPEHKSLKAIGEVCGVPKIELPEDVISDMSDYRRSSLLDFLEYGINDAVIVSEYLAMLWGRNVVPPVTLSGGGASAVKAGIMRYMGVSLGSEFLMRFRGLVKIADPVAEDLGDQLTYYAARELRPVDGDANQAHTACKSAFHGGWNSCLAVGRFEGRTFDHDIQSAYPSAMAAISDVDYVNGCIESVVKDRELTLDDFPDGFTTPLVAYVSWKFPDDTQAPCIPVVSGDSVIYPLTSEGAGASQGDELSSYEGFEGAWVYAPELLLALKLGATVTAQIGYRMKVLRRPDGSPSRALREALKGMVNDRSAAKDAFGKGSLEEKTIKVATNSVYGKLAQDVAERNGWNSFEEQMEAIGGSSVTSPYHAGMTTSLVRALLLAVANQIEVLSVTTDGFISRESDIESLDAFGLADVFRESRLALVGDSTVWEVKHSQDVLFNFSTRANVGPEDGNVLARGGLKFGDDIERGSVHERRYFINIAVTRVGKLANRYFTFPTTRELTRSVNRRDFLREERCPLVSTIDFDLKRQPVRDSLTSSTVEIEGQEYELACFSTVPWVSVREYERARAIASHMQAYRPGTTGDDRPTGCLRSPVDWEVFFARYEAAPGRRIRSASSKTLNELVAAHKAGLVTINQLDSLPSVDAKIEWLSSLGFGVYTRSMWEHMSKSSRRLRVIDDADLAALTELVDELNGVGEGVA